MLRGALAASALLWACGGLDHSGPDYGSAKGGSSASTSAAGDAGSDAGASPIEAGAGSAIRGGGRSIEVEPGLLPATNGGAAGGGSLARSRGGTGGEAASGGSGGSTAGDGAVSGSGDESVDLCAFATLDGGEPLNQSDLIGIDYRQVLTQDCHFSGLSCGFGSSAKRDLANNLRHYGPQLWHCNDAVATEFRLVYLGRKVTQPDAEALIDLYVTLTSRRLLLTNRAAASLRNQLFALMSQALAEDADPISLCDMGGVCPMNGAAGGTANGGTGGGGVAGFSTSRGGAD